MELPHESDRRKRRVDNEARVGLAESANLQGVVTEADTLEALRARLALIVPVSRKNRAWSTATWQSSSSPMLTIG